MIVVSGSLRMSEADLGSIRDAARETVLATRAEAGCVAYVFSIDLVEPGTLRIYEEWESREALAAHGRTPHIAAWRQHLSALQGVERELKLAEIDAFEPFA